MTTPTTWDCRYVPLDYEPEEGERLTEIPGHHGLWSHIAVKEVVEDDE